MIAQTSGHRWRNPQRLVDSPEVVIHEVERHGCSVVLELLGKGTDLDRF